MERTLPRSEVAARLQTAFRRCFSDDTLVLDEAMTADDIDGWDSLSHVRLMMSVEDEFGVRIKAAETARLDNVGALIDYLAARFGG